MPGANFTGDGKKDISNNPTSTSNPEHGSRSTNSDIKFTGKGAMDAGKVNQKTQPNMSKADGKGPIKFTGDGSKGI